ncbi:hypothetical protein [Polaribacter sp. M15]
MKHKLYKQIITFIAIGFLGTTFAQKFDKKFTENFKTNKDVEVAINASNTDINVTTWAKNEVQVDAFIEIEGIDKDEAEKYFKNWEFEALGNSKKVKITSKGSNGFTFKNDFVFFDDMNFDFEIPDIDMSNVEAIVLPDIDFDMDFDFDFDFKDLDDLGENMGKNGKYEFRWKDDNHDIEINSKEEWEAFKKTKAYKELKEKMKVDKEKMRKEIAASKEKMKKTFAKGKLKIKEINTEEIKKSLAKAKQELKKLNFHFSSGTNDIKINGKKVKIKKRLEIKVPKGATFDLNTRHCKVKLPNTIAFGNVKYGSFDANNLYESNLTIEYSPVNINNLNACTLFLNNVTDAKIASVTNTTMNNNSSGVNILKINQNVTLSDKFGELIINSFHPNFGEFILNLSQSNATIILGDVPTKYKYQVNRIKMENQNLKNSLHTNTTKNLIKVSGDYSTILIK